MKSFFERWRPVFEIVARLLGNGWRVNLLDDCQYRIKLTTPELKRYALTVREEKGRLVIHGFVESRQWHGYGARCTVSYTPQNPHHGTGGRNKGAGSGAEATGRAGTGKNHQRDVGAACNTE